MTINYHNIAKKSIFIYMLSVLLFCGVSVSAKVPNDINYSTQKAMWEIIKAPEAWVYGTGSKDVTVAIIDVGVDIYHPDLEDNIWINVFEIPGNGKDDDKNGFIDDVNGWNFVDENNIVRPSVLNNKLDKKIISHGTVAAGLIGAKGDNEVLGTGINWNVKIMPIVAVGTAGTGSYQNVVNAIRYATNNGAQVINLSFTSAELSVDLINEVYNSYKKGVVVVAAGGNDFTDLNKNPIYPACADELSDENWVLGVGAMTNGKTSTNFSNYGSSIDLYAPGQDIYSTERYAPMFGFEDKFGGPWQGTSFAAPIVAGGAALIKSIQPNWNAIEIIKTILARTDLKKGEREKSQGIALNIEDAVKIAYKSLEDDPILDCNYTLEKGIVYKNKQKLKKYITKVINGSIIDITSKNVINSYESEVFVLYRIKDYYFIRILDGNAKVLREFSLSDILDDFKPSLIQIRTNREGKDYILISDDNRTVIYSIAGKRL